MSGSTIGGVVGAAVGFWFGGPEGARWGWMAGSIVGGAVDPDVIRAPSIGDAQTQTSQAGVPIPRIYGKPQRIKCNIIDGETKARKIIVESQQGKGGPVVEEERFLLTSAFGVCNGPIAGIQRIFRNGEPVIDLSIDEEYPTYSGGSIGDRLAYVLAMRAKTASWSGRIRVYLGDDTQLPDPSLEAIHGVGNTPYFRGLAYFVVVDDDVTQMRGRANVWEVEPIAEGVEATIPGTTSLEIAGYSQFVNAHWPLAGPESDYVLTARRYINGSTVETFSAATIAEIIEHYNQLGFEGVKGPPSYYLGYSAATGAEPDTFKLDTVAIQPDVRDNDSVILVYNVHAPDYAIDYTGYGSSACPNVPLDSGTWTMVNEGELLQRIPTGTSAGGSLITNCADDEFGTQIRTILPLYIKATRKRIVPDDGLTPIPGADGWGVDENGNVEQLRDYALTTGTFKVLSIEQKATVDGRFQYTNYEIGPILALGDPDYNNATFWTDAYDAAVLAGDLPAGWVYNTDYPETVTDAYSATTADFDTLQATDVTLQSVWEDMAFTCARVPVNRMDASALGTDIIPGYLVATNGSVADALRPTQQGFFFDTPDYDGAIRCIKRGGAVAVTVTDDDLLEQTDEDRQTEPQALEFPRAVHVMVPDPDASYTITPQTAERYSPDVRAVGESSLYLPIPFRADRTKQIAGVMLKVAWAQAEGRIELPLPEEFSQYVASDCFNYLGKRWRIEETTYADGEVRWKAVYDRSSAYTLAGEGVPAGTPELPSTGIAGPTAFEVLNLSPLADEDDRIGFYVAARGLLPDWPGARFQASADDGATWVDGPEVTTASVMGELLTELGDATEHFFYPDATFDVRVSGDLESITFLDVLNEGNLAVVGTELIQFQTATDNGDGEYTLTGLLRGRLATDPTTHYDADRFVLLNAPAFFEVPPSFIGRDLLVRAVTLGTDAASNESQALTFRPVEAQHEWQPVRFSGTRDSSNNITVSAVARGRLGNTAAPYHSANVTGYRLTFSKGGSQTVRLYSDLPVSYTAAQQTIDFGSATGTLTVEIETMNRITGPGPFLTGKIT